MVLTQSVPSGTTVAILKVISAAAAREKLAELSPMHGRPGLPEDVANAALWLASDESGYTTGHTLTTDAGITVGATPEGPQFAEYEPIIREAGKSGLGD